MVSQYFASRMLMWLCERCRWAWGPWLWQNTLGWWTTGGPGGGDILHHGLLLCDLCGSGECDTKLQCCCIRTCFLRWHLLAPIDHGSQDGPGGSGPPEHHCQCKRVPWQSRPDVQWGARLPINWLLILFFVMLVGALLFMYNTWHCQSYSAL